LGLEGEKHNTSQKGINKAEPICGGERKRADTEKKNQEPRLGFRGSSPKAITVKKRGKDQAGAGKSTALYFRERRW